MSTIPEYLDALKARFPSGGDWGEKLAAVLAMEAELPMMPMEEKTPDTRFHGCQSQIWLVVGRDPETGRFVMKVDSDARIMRGLLAIAHGYYHDRMPEEIAAHPPILLRDAGLLDALAPSRANGFYRLLLHIHGLGSEMAARAKDQVA
ncbi:SufE family protein [Chelatococcus asaccharovorans]|nr:SufE family protein [Chelatococcus asaccharovorans]MBS7705409.1 SufE family protein [Chelatococcus asaccharovorans]